MLYSILLDPCEAITKNKFREANDGVLKNTLKEHTAPSKCFSY